MILQLQESRLSFLISKVFVKCSFDFSVSAFTKIVRCASWRKANWLGRGVVRYGGVHHWEKKLHRGHASSSGWGTSQEAFQWRGDAEVDIGIVPEALARWFRIVC